MHSILLIALGTLVSEDLTCLAVGVWVAQGEVGFLAGTLACLVGIFVGDILLFLLGRFGGRVALKWIPKERVDRASEWISRKGMSVIFLSRFTPGLRLPTYLAAGLLKTN